MASNIPECFKELLKNSDEDFSKAANLLLRIARNIVSNPTVDKYQSIQVGSKTFMDSLLPVDGAVQCLLEMGFEEAGERFKYQNRNLERLKNMKSILEKLIDNKLTSKVTAVTLKNADTSNENAIALQGDSEATTYRKLVHEFEHVLVYESERLQAKARSVIPLDRLSKTAKEKLRDNPQFSSHNGSVPLDYDDCMILALLEWFKFDFFKWVNAAPCLKCPQSTTEMVGMLSPTNDDTRWGAGRVEGYRCNNCGDVVRFPRYNNPEKLLETREGRCGEWANCFSLLCRSLGYDTRHVLDWTDHVWTEVYSKAAKRWIHCDPCENAFDKPLVYEEGWGKQLSLLVAASCDEIVDVTWRYSDKPKELMPRRSTMFREKWLENVLKNLNKTRQSFFTPERKSVLEKRKMREVAELASPKVKSSIVYGGRTSGSVEWRTARGEMGSGEAEQKERELCPKEYSKGKDNGFLMQYFSNSNKYLCSVKRDASGWDSLTYSSSNIQRKKEHDWKMVYLARTPSTEKAHISWKFDLKKLPQNVVIKSASIKFEFTEFQSGKVNLLLCTENKSVPLCGNELLSLRREVYGARTLSIHAFLTGGDGGNAWQHTQLFRTSTKSGGDDPQFTVSIQYGE